MPFLKHSKTYYRYLLSYMALLLVGILALLAFFRFYFVRGLKESLLDAQRNALEQTAQSLDGGLNQINAIDYQTSSFNENLLSFYLSESSPMRDLRIVREFKNLLAPSTFISEVARFEPGSNTVYTSTAVYSSEVFFNEIYLFDGWDAPEAALAELKTRAVAGVDHIEQFFKFPERYLAFINPPSVFSKLGTAIQIFYIKEEKFYNALAPKNTYRQGAILDDQGALLLSTLPFDAADLSGSDYTRLDGVDYMVFRANSDVLNWQYLSIIPVSEGMGPVYRAYNTLGIMLGLILAVGLLVISYCMRITYTPLKELALSLSASPQRDDMESLKVVISTLSEQNETMRCQLMLSPDGQALKDALLFSLLKGKFDSFEDFNQEGAPLGMRFDKPWYQVLMLRYFDRNDEDMPRDTLSKALDAALGQNYQYHFRELFEPSMIICLVGMDERARGDAQACYERLIACGVSEFGLSFTVGASCCYQDIRRISVACFEATQAVTEYFVRGRNQLINFADVCKPIPECGDFLTRLDNLRSETPAQRMQTIASFIKQLKDMRLPSLLAKSYCNSAVQILLSSQASHARMDDLFAISYLKTADDYQSFMMRMLEDDLNASAPADIIDTSSELLNRIYALTAESYDNCNFSIQDSADKLGLSSSYVSQYFKQQTGDTLTNHVAGLRIKKARSLLETTAMPLQMISESVGYYNLNSFIRRFKQITGVTPGEYRRTYQ